MNMTILAFSFGWSEVYLTCLLLGLIFAVASALLSGVGHHGELHGHDFGGGHDAGGHDVGGHGVGGDAAASSLSDPSIHFSPLSPVVLAMFVTTFGGVGLLCDRGFGLPWLLHLPLATIAGVAFGAVTFYLFARIVLWAQGFSQTSVNEALGLTAEVIIPIPEGGMGKIAYTVQERRFTAGAHSVDGKAIANHTLVTIENISGSTFMVRPSDEEQLRKLDSPAANA